MSDIPLKRWREVPLLQWIECTKPTGMKSELGCSVMLYQEYDVDFKDELFMQNVLKDPFNGPTFEASGFDMLLD